MAAVTVTTPVDELIAKRPPALSSSEYVTTSVPSASVARPVIPTVVPFAEFSLTKSAAALLSVTAVTLLSFTSVKLIVYVCVEYDPSTEVARMVML